MATFTLFHEALKFIGDGTIDLDSHTFKAYLSTATPLQATHTIKTDIAEIAAGFGYTAGGNPLGSVTWTETGGGTGVWRFNCADPTWTAAGGPIATHQYLIIYDDTAASDQLLGFVNRGTSDVIADGNTRTWDVGSSGLFEVSTTP
jgi:hypothetical protein